MDYETLIKHYGTQVVAAAAIGVKQPTISEWKQKGIPYLRQLHIEKLTRGKLKASQQKAKAA